MRQLGWSGQFLQSLLLLHPAKEKEDILKIITKKYSVKNSEIGYIGDDVNDIELLKKVGFSATPQDGISEVRSIVDHICEKKGGEGAFREIVDIFLRYIP